MFHPSPASRRALVALCAAFAGLPLAAHAQVFKCTKPDGSVAFQASPCPGSIKAAPPRSAPVAKAASSEPYFDPYSAANASQRAALPVPQGRQQAAPPPPVERVAAPDTSKAGPAAVRRQMEEQARRDDPHRQEADERVRQLEAANRAQRCEVARSNVDVLSQQRPVYTLDKNGQRQFVEDANRDKTMAAAKQQVAENCR